MPAAKPAAKVVKERDLPQVRIDALRGKQFSLPHAGNSGEALPFVVGEDGLVQGSLSAEQAEAIVRLYHLHGAVLVA
jgi:hypothetical protein